MTEPSLGRVAYSICKILCNKDSLKVSEIQDVTKFGRETVVFSLGWLLGQGVVILQGKMKDFEVSLAVENRSSLGEFA